MKTVFFDHINIQRENTYVPNGCAADLKAEGEAYDEFIKKLGGIDRKLKRKIDEKKQAHGLKQ